MTKSILEHEAQQNKLNNLEPNATTYETQTEKKKDIDISVTSNNVHLFLQMIYMTSCGLKPQMPK